MTSLCGHEREAVRRRLIVVCMRDSGHVSVDDQEHRRKLILSNAASDARRVELAAIYAKCDEIDALLLDSAKLAAMMAEEGRRLGFAERGAEIVDIDAPIPMPMCTLAEHGRVVICVLVPQKPRWKRYMLTTPQARAILLQWLKLPDGTREEAENVLRGIV